MKQKLYRGFIARGSNNNFTAFLSNNNNETVCSGDFVTIDKTSTFSGLYVKKANPSDKPLGMVILTPFKNIFYPGESLTIAPMNQNVKVAVEPGGIFNIGDELELKKDNGVHKVIKKTTKHQKVGIALENSNINNEAVLILLETDNQNINKQEINITQGDNNINEIIMGKNNKIKINKAKKRKNLFNTIFNKICKLIKK